MRKKISLTAICLLVFLTFGFLVPGEGNVKSAQATDLSPCLSSNSSVLSIDLTLNTVPVINSSNQNAITLSGTGIPNLQVIYQVIAGTKDISGHVPADNNGNFLVTLDLSSLPDGDVFFTVIQKIDECNEKMASQKSIKETVPPPAPTFQVNCTASSSGQSFFSISGTAPDAVTVEYKISDGVHTDISGTVNVDSGHNFAINNINVTGLNSPADVSVASKDENGNVSQVKHEQVNLCFVQSQQTTTNVTVETKPVVVEKKEVVLLPQAGAHSLWFNLSEFKLESFTF